MGLKEERTKHDCKSELLKKAEDAEKGIESINSFGSIEEFQWFMKLAREDLSKLGIQIADFDRSTPERLIISFDKFSMSG